MAKNEYGLTPKQEAFALEYLIDLNGTAAAKRAGFSEKTANEYAAKLMANPVVKARIDQLISKRAERTEITADRVLALVFEIAKFDIGKLYGEAGNLLHPSQMDEATRRVISSIDVFEEFDFIDKEKVQIGVTKKIKLWDKGRALESLMKHLGLLKDKVEHSGSVTLEQLVAGAGDDESA